MRKSIFLGLLMFTISASSSAQDVNLQAYGCHQSGLSFTNQGLTLTGQTGQPSQRLYLMQNKTGTPVIVNHPQKENAGAKAGWETKIDSGQWSALLVNKPSFALSCISRYGETDNIVPCAIVLMVCQLPHVIVSQKDQVGGAYWVAENMTLNRVLFSLQQRGISFGK